jgi:signal transduction histidine kinase
MSEPLRSDDVLRRINAALEQQARAIGQALHDEAGQVLTAAYHALAEAAELSPPQARQRLDVVKAHLDCIEEQLLRVANELRPRILDDVGLVAAIRFLADRARLYRGIDVKVVAAVDVPLSPTVETAVYRMVQEAMTNIIRHARATRVEVTLAQRAGLLVCKIRDNGVGLDAAEKTGGGLGLIGIRDRLAALGSTLTIRSARRRGTQLATTIRLENRDAVADRAGGRSSDRP